MCLLTIARLFAFCRGVRDVSSAGRNLAIIRVLTDPPALHPWYAPIHSMMMSKVSHPARVGYDLNQR